jgi:phosphoribosylamine--glycine ligase
MNILILGSGGREHALAWAVARSPLLTKLYAAPGNAGIAGLATCLPLNPEDPAAVLAAAGEHRIDFVIVGPEAVLVAGIVDALEAAGIPAFGPNQAAAAIEGSKGFMKDIAKKADVPTAAYARFTDAEKAKAYVRQQGAPIVVKADGLAAGKGVTVAMTEAEAMSAIDAALLDKAFGDAGAELVIEEYMEGEEASFFALVDGEKAIPFAHAQDHKRVFDGDKGPNTGGMGAYSPAPIVTADMQRIVMETIILPTAKAMVKNGTPFRGVLFAGLMLTKTGPRLIEYNARFGDPETQVMLARLQSDLLDVLFKLATGKIDDIALSFHDTHALCVVMAAKGYPGAYKKGTPIRDLDKAAQIPGSVVFHAGTTSKDNTILANGGRVLGVTGYAGTLQEAQKNAYKAVDTVDWPEGFCRRDIGWRAL